MKPIKFFLNLSLVAIFSIISTSSFANMSGSSLISESSYLPGKTNTIAFRCDWVTTDDEWAYTIGVNYKSNMFVTAGYKGYGDQNLSATKGLFSYNNALGEAVEAQWNSDENINTGYGGISDGKSGYFTNEVYISPSLSGDIVLNYSLIGDGWGAEPHNLTNSLTLKEWFPEVKLNPSSQTSQNYPGKSLDFSMSIFNDTGADDDFNISYESLWAAAGITSSGLLTNKTSKDFTINVTIPADALAGQVSTTTVTAVGVNDTSFTGTTEIIVVCVWNKVILDENFDEDPFENGWIQYNLGAPTGWVWYTSFGNLEPCMKHWTIAQPCTNWLVTPSINLEGNYNFAQLTFEEYFYNDDTNLHPYIYSGLWISTNQQNPTAGTYIELQEFGSHYGGWTDSDWEINLFDYIGFSNVYLAFLYIGNDAANHYLDNVKIESIRTGIDSATLISPSTIAIQSYASTPNVTASLFIDGETGSAGPASNITAQFGYGIAGTIPDDTWTWNNSQFSHSDATKDFFITNSFITQAGDFDFTYRFKKGDATWVYADFNGSSNGYNSADSGDLSVSFPQPTDDFIGYKQTLLDAPDNWVVSFENGVPIEIVTADDFISPIDMELKSVRWKGVYQDDFPRNGLENGFNLFIYENTIVNGTNQPGSLLFTEYQAGYCSEMLSNNLYLYQLDLVNSFTVLSRTTYWFAVQMEMSGDSRWAICNTQDATEENNPAAKGEFYFNDNLWHPDVATYDLGFEIYGAPAASMALTPLKQKVTGFKGGSVDVPLTILNFTGASDTFNFSEESCSWPAIVPADSGIMNHEDETIFTVNIPILNTAIAGQISTTIVTAVGTSDPSYTNYAKIFVECVGKKDIYLDKFEIWPPEGWYPTSTFGNVSGWIQYENWALTHPVPTTLCSNWFVSPAFDLNINGADKMFIDFRDIAIGTYDYTALMVSTGDSDPAHGNYEELIELSHTDNSWTDRNIDISNYIGSNPVYFAFLYAGANGHQAYIDDFYIYATADFIDNATVESPHSAAIESYGFLSITGSLEIAAQTGVDGPAENISCQFGYGHKGILPESGQWSWQETFYDSSSGKLDYYMITSAVVTASGKLDYGFRVKQGETEWVYADIDGSSNGFAAATAGKLSVSFPELIGSVTYKQSLRDTYDSATISFENGAKETVIAADDFSPDFDTKIKTVRWKGSYGSSYPREGSEKGFKIYFYGNTVTHGTNHPGNILYSEFFDGYASEMITNDLYLYQVDLANEFTANGGSTYWFAVQNFCVGVSRWAFSTTADSNLGSAPAIWSPLFLSHSNWITGLVTDDFGFEFYAAVPQIIVKGNGINIVNGDNSPTASDFTDFGLAEFDFEIITNSFTIENSGSDNLTVSDVSLTAGTSAFSVIALPMSVFVPGTSSTFQIVFDPIESGIINGTISIANNAETPFVFDVRGEGVPEPVLFFIYYLSFFIYYLKRNRK